MLITDMATVLDVEFMYDKFNAVGMCTNVIYAQKLITELCNY